MKRYVSCPAAHSGQVYIEPNYNFYPFFNQFLFLKGADGSGPGKESFHGSKKPACQ